MQWYIMFSEDHSCCDVDEELKKKRENVGMQFSACMAWDRWWWWSSLVVQRGCREWGPADEPDLGQMESGKKWRGSFTHLWELEADL